MATSCKNFLYREQELRWGAVWKTSFLRATLLRKAVILTSLILAVACAPVKTSQQGIETSEARLTQPGSTLEMPSSVGTLPSHSLESLTPEPTPRGTVLAPEAPATSGPSVKPALGTPVPVIVEPDQVTITLSKLAYAAGEAIEATIANGLTQAVYTEDSKSDCSIAILEQWDGQTWHPLLGCAVGRPPLVVAIGPGQGQMVRIDPFSVHFGVSPGAAAPAFGGGTYRIKFAYRLEPGPEGETPYEVYSKEFSINP